MNRPLFWIFAALSALGFYPAPSAGAGDVPLVQRQWFETRTAHFNIYSCGAPQEVNKVAGQLEEFCEAYSLLAGAQAVASPPIVVMAFPDHESMKPFLPLYHGQPENLSGFFQHGNDENLIVLSLPEAGAASMDMSVVFHEYTHLLFRRNDRIWPLWLKEGMAEVYSTFATTGYSALIAQPIDHHLQLLAHEPLMPLTELFAVTHDSPQYNERERQGIFYAESWLLTHFLMAGDNADYKSRFGNFTALLREGQTPVQAFTNALQTTLPAVESELHRYLERGQFAPIKFAFPENVAGVKTIATRNLTPVENYFRLGDELLRIDRLDDAEKYFTDAQKLAPASPLPYEGLGLLAIRREQTGEALREFKAALQRGSNSFLAHYFYAWEKFRVVADAQGDRGSLPGETAAEIHGELLKSIVLMPNFGPSHELFGILEMAQGENLPLAEQHLQLAVQLEPDNPYYLLALADAQARNKDPEAARRTLTALFLPTVEAKLRAQAEELLQQITGANSIR
jgi:tetratricopeptide (TPR) repeat protein